MNGYLGETTINWVNIPEYEDFTQADWAMKWIEMYGGIDGAHHKDWVLDHVARILNGAEITVKQASWENGHKELRFSVSESCEKYDAWVQEMRGEYDEENEEYEYFYEVGSAP